MIVYEVHLVTAAEIRESFTAWMGEHLEQMLEFDGFRRASFMKIDTARSADFFGLGDGEDAWLCQYEIAGQAHLDSYLRDHAHRMRGEGSAKFGERMRAFRRVATPFLTRS